MIFQTVHRKDERNAQGTEHNAHIEDPRFGEPNSGHNSPGGEPPRAAVGALGRVDEQDRPTPGDAAGSDEPAGKQATDGAQGETR